MQVAGKLWIVTELPTGWRLTDAYRGTHRDYRAAADVLRSIKRRDQRCAARMGQVVGLVASRVEWNTNTAVGRMIVRALQ